MAARLTPTAVQQIGQNLAVAWSDGQETILSLESLRRSCPCASCGGEPDVLGFVDRPEVSYTTASFQLKSWQEVGGYALQPLWGDGHRTGLYSFKLLRQLGEADAVSEAP